MACFRTLEREEFGSVQSKLFPKYALLNTALSIVMITAQWRLGWDWSNWNCLALVGTWLINEANLLYLFPKQIDALEEKAAEKNEDKKKALQKKFGKFHGISMLLNFTAMALNWYTLFTTPL